MDIIQLLQSLVAQLEDLKVKLADAEVALAAEKQASYDQGFAAGVASVPTNGDLIFSQSDLDAAVANAVAPLQSEIEGLKEQVLALQQEIDQKVSEAVAAFKANILAQYQAAQDLEGSVEADFANLLK